MRYDSDDTRRNRTRRTANRPGTTSSGRPGEPTAQIGSDGVEPGIHVGGNVTVDSSGDVGVRVAPGVSVQVTPDTPAGTDGCTSGM